MKPGDIVNLKSGGPLMTVNSVKGHEIECVWNDDRGRPGRGMFIDTSLKPKIK